LNTSAICIFVIKSQSISRLAINHTMPMSPSRPCVDEIVDTQEEGEESQETLDVKPNPVDPCKYHLKIQAQMNL
jgi:hypothetical protein